MVFVVPPSETTDGALQERRMRLRILLLMMAMAGALVILNPAQYAGAG
jgi:hypothetical protein